MNKASIKMFNSRIILLGSLLFISVYSWAQNSSETPKNIKSDGYKGIWFELNQKYEYGDKYSGALSTYTAKHTPLAIYAKEVDKTFFVYGGTKAEDQRHLLCMIGEFNHTTGTVVYDKNGVDDPHDNPSLTIDAKGYIWVFVSGRGSKRPGFKFRSTKRFDTGSFDLISEEEFTYPQPWSTQDGFVHLFTKYTGVRQLYYETSKDGINWTEDKQLAAIPVNKGEKSGHYQTSLSDGKNRVGTFFNRHPNGNVDVRTDLYYLQTTDFANTWTNVEGQQLSTPLLVRESKARVIDYQSQKKNVYLKDMGFDIDGRPVGLYIRSNGHEPGPKSAPFEWCVTNWDGKAWQTNVITTSDHNYDMGSIFIEGNIWKVVGPTEKGPQEYGVGGEIAIWQSSNQGTDWKKIKDITKNSNLSHSYVRRPINYKAPFSFFWSDGHSHNFSKSELYFGDFDGNIWKLPYEMKNEFEKPIKIDYE
jgi:penicillin-binding protein-related factor A (putative recombinase)